ATLTLAPGYDDSGSYPGVEITVTDDGEPPLSDSETITITVADVPVETLEISREVSPERYTPGQTLDVAVTFTYDGSDPVTALGLFETLPDGWTYVEPVSGPSAVISPTPGQGGTLEFAWLAVPAFPATFVYRVEVPAEESGTQMISGYAEYRLCCDPIQTSVLETSIPEQSAPVANPDSYTVPEDQTLTIVAPGVLGNDTDAEGNALAAVLVTGPGHGALTFNADGSFVYTPAANYNGADSFTYRANDGSLDSNEAAVTITVTPVNDAPVADAGDDQINALTGRTITLDGSDSYDVDGDLIAYEWRFQTLPPASALTDNDIAGWDTASPSFIPDVAGDFVLELVVRDYELDSDPDYVMVSADAQAAPNADAGGNQETLLGDVVVLDGCSSYDPDNGPEPLTYAWSFFSVAAGSALTDDDIVDSTLCSASFTPDVAGVYELVLTVSDGFESDIAVAVITVTEQENVPPVADAGSDQSVAYGTQAYLDGSASYDPDSGPQPLAFLWSFVSLPALSGLTNDDISGRTTALPWFTPDVAGNYVLQLEVTDGEDTATDNVEVICVKELTFQDVTGRVSMSTANESAYMTSRITRMMVCTADLTITNVSTETIELPIHAVFVGTAPGSIPGRWQIDMPEASGQRENGDFYYDLGEKTGITELLPGQSVTFQIKFVFHFSLLHRFSEVIQVWGMAP
ncbi:MAG TPA: tandem-95 repeat protein, partial [Candidatus Hydrogenedentes bacterium]|nr:tandem-95 repeat protein [Candidatus Hydrogenedentota bacterium]